MRNRILNVILTVLFLLVMLQGKAWADQYLPIIHNDPTPLPVETKSTPPPVETKSTPTSAPPVETKSTPTSAPPVEPTNAPPVEPTQDVPVTPVPPDPTIVPVDPTSTPTPELIPPHPTATTVPQAICGESMQIGITYTNVRPSLVVPASVPVSSLPFSVPVTDNRADGPTIIQILEWKVGPARWEAEVNVFSNPARIGPFSSNCILKALLGHWDVDATNSFVKAVPPTVTPTASPTATPTATSTATPPFYFGVDYEDGQTHGVNSSEESYKTVTFSVGQPAQHGSNALKVETKMSIHGLPVNRYTEVTQYFDRAGWPTFMNLIDKKVSWAVYIPHELFAGGENPIICAYLFVRDAEHNPQNSQQQCFKEEQAGTWTTYEITVNVEENGYIDPLFDPDTIRVVGVRFTVAGDLDHEGWIASMDDLKVGY